MTTLFVGNFEFEHRLASSSPRQLPHSLRRINHELATLWVAIAEDGDFIWTPATVEQGFFEELASLGLPPVEPLNDERCPAEPVEVCPWGWTDEIRKWANLVVWTWGAAGVVTSEIRDTPRRRQRFYILTELGSEVWRRLREDENPPPVKKEARF